MNYKPDLLQTVPLCLVRNRNHPLRHDNLNRVATNRKLIQLCKMAAFSKNNIGMNNELTNHFSSGQKKNRESHVASLPPPTTTRHLLHCVLQFPRFPPHVAHRSGGAPEHQPLKKKPEATPLTPFIHNGSVSLKYA